MTQVASVTAGRGPDMTALEAAILDPAVAKRLMSFALAKTGHAQDAEDLYQSTLEAAVRKDQTGEPWKGPPPPASMYLGSVLNGAFSNARRARFKKSREVEGEIEHVPSGTPDAEQGIVALTEQEQRDRELAAIKAELRSHLEDKKDTVSLKLLDAAERALKGGQATADAIGCTLKDVNNARLRTQAALDRVLKKRRGGGGAAS
jgi:DNA-directed RNA polymerase specialized sigma24 family protein